MDNFREFVNVIVEKWGKKNQPLGGLKSQKTGKEGEDYVCNKVKKLKYKAYKTKGSRSPADIISVSKDKIKNHWHIMLIQIKASKSEKRLKKMNLKKDYKEPLKELAKMSKAYIKTKKSVLKDYQNDNIIITTGTARVLKGKKSRLFQTEYFENIKVNCKEVEPELLEKIQEKHFL
jgi:hypothetical protein